MAQIDVIKFRRDTVASWTSVNPILNAGEPGFETDTFKHKIGNGVTAYNDLPYAGGGATGAVHASTATLIAGTVTVLADWVTADTVITALPQTAPGVAGSIIYADPADIVAATSFQLKSDDATDTRTLFWMATEPTQARTGGGDSFPDLFYASFRVRFAQSEIDANNGGDFFGINLGGAANSGEYSLAPFRGGGDTDWTTLSSITNCCEDDYVVTLAAATWYVIDIKFDRAADHLTQDITVRLDGVELGTLADTTGAPWNVLEFALGGIHSSRTSSRDFDYFKIGSTAYGTDDLFSADFSALSPFDSLVGTGATVGSGMLSVVNSSAYGYAFKTL